MDYLSEQVTLREGLCGSYVWVGCVFRVPGHVVGFPVYVEVERRVEFVERQFVSVFCVLYGGSHFKQPVIEVPLV